MIEVSSDWWKTLFDEIYLQTDARSIDNEKLTRIEIDLICQLIPLQPHHFILDLCGGQGRHSIELYRRGFERCTVFDYSKALLKIGAEQARRGNYRIEFVQGDARDTQLRSELFDCVLILGNSLGYIPEADADLRIIHESHRLLKPGGWLLLDVTDGAIVRNKFTPNAWHEIGTDMVVCRQRQLEGATISVREMVMSKQSGLIRDESYCVRLYEAAELIDLVTRAGFVEGCRHTEFDPLLTEADLGFMNHRMLVSARKRNVQKK